MKLVTGALFVILGAVVVVRTAGMAGLRLEAIPAYVLGLAMIGLGATRYWPLLRGVR